MKKSILVIIAVAILIGGYYAYIYWALGNDSDGQQVVAVATATDYKNTAYSIDGTSVMLKDGVAEVEAAPGSAAKITTKYFGNDFKTDLNNDGREDIVFLLTQETGGTGIFYYAVAALNLEQGYIGSDGYFLGDRIAPQTIELSSNPKHQKVIVVNYADREKEEPMSVVPSVGKSAYLKLDTENMMWAIVEPNFEGESR